MLTRSGHPGTTAFGQCHFRPNRAAGSKTILALLASAFLAPATMAVPMDDLTAPIHQFLDGFNTGNVKSAYAAYAAGDITIVDEFAPHRWVGPKAPQAWAADYDKHAQATGVSDGVVKYGQPTRTEVEGNVAYVIIPTVTFTRNTANQPPRKGK